MPAASTVPSPSVFALPDHLAHKSAPAVIAHDEQHLAAITRTLESRVADLSSRLDARRREPAGRFAQTIERDADIRRLVAELATLRRFGLDLCIGHVATTAGERVYVGRIGLIDESGTPLLVDWRTPAAEPYFAATLAAPGDVAYRRRYRWSGGRIVDFWDEVLVDDDNAVANANADTDTGTGTGTGTGTSVSAHTVPDDQSAFVSSLSGARTGRMRDVLSTIQSDQDAIIRAGAEGAVVVDGGPGTGKTVVAMHRAAFLLHEQSRSGISRGNLLLVGPHRPYLDYVSDVLPALGEHGVQTATVADLAGAALTGPAAIGTTSGASSRGSAPRVRDVDDLPDEADSEVAGLKSTVEMVDAIETAVRFYEEPPTESMIVPTEWLDLRLTPADWTEAFTSVEDGTPHNEAHDQIWDTLVEILQDKAGVVGDKAGREIGVEVGRIGDRAGNEAGGVGDEPGNSAAASLRAELSANAELRRTLARAWPMITPGDLVGDLWTVPAYLRLCAPWLSTDQLRLLQRPDPHAWTTADLPLLDTAQHRLGDADRARRGRRRKDRQAELDLRRTVIDEAIAADDDPEGVTAMLRHVGMQEALLDPSLDELAGPTGLAGQFGHIIVDEAQELTDAQWRMLLRRCPSGSLTVVGDRAQSRGDFGESWSERLERVGLSPERVRTRGLSINYRTPSEVMDAAAPVIRAVRPDANVPESVRSSGVPVEEGRIDELSRVLGGWVAESHDGVACVITASGAPLSEFVAAAECGATAGDGAAPDVGAAVGTEVAIGIGVAIDSGRIRALSPADAKGLEFDLVVLVDPDSFGQGVTGAVDRYVAMTRSTQRLVVLR